MAVIYLKHPVHGSKVACSEFEAEHDKALGWEVFDPEVKSPEVPAFLAPSTEVPAFLAPAQTEKPKGRGGRPKK